MAEGACIGIIQRSVLIKKDFDGNVLEVLKNGNKVLSEEEVKDVLASTPKEVLDNIINTASDQDTMDKIRIVEEA